MDEERAQHWAEVYEGTAPDRVSWYEPEPERSLRLVEASGVAAEAAILDVGGGTSRLALRLVQAGYRDVTVADISPAALARARADAGEAAEQISWVRADVRTHVFPRRYALWHDRAVLHFMVDPEDRAAYLATLRRTLLPGGHAIVITFGPNGPERCSGLATARYDAQGLAAVLGEAFVEIESGTELHRTPGGSDQEFLYTLFRRRQQ